MKVFITDLESYNNGLLVGNWYTLPIGEDSLAECNEDVLYLGRQALKSDHHHEETFITDWECEYMDIEEYANLEELNQIATDMRELDSYDTKRYTALKDNGCNHEEALRGYEDVDLYEDTTLKELAEQFVDDGLFGEIPEAIQNYLDYDSIARDLSYDYTEVGNDIVRVA